MHAGNDHNPMAFHLEEKALGEAPHAHATNLRMHNLKGDGTAGHDVHDGIHGQSKAHAKVRMNALPSERFFQVGIRFR
ncbi:MAG TPA: hypothetical protein VHD76_11455 [Bryobacteraceae bacterium]|jgi:hypothetical protein|nr:hypothetical protein [Bryobacteraceae bacterium]